MSMAVLMFIENIKLWMQKGEELLIDKSFSVIETIWLVVSIWWLFKLDGNAFATMAISVFIGYHIFGWLVGLRAYQLSEEAESDTIVIPLWYFKVNLIISAAYFIVLYFAYASVGA